MLDHHDKRAILLMVLQVLENYSDEKHPLPMEGERSLQPEYPVPESEDPVGRVRV